MALVEAFSLARAISLAFSLARAGPDCCHETSPLRPQSWWPLRTILRLAMDAFQADAAEDACDRQKMRQADAAEDASLALAGI